MREKTLCCAVIVGGLTLRLLNANFICNGDEIGGRRMFVLNSVLNEEQDFNKSVKDMTSTAANKSRPPGTLRHLEILCVHAWVPDQTRLWGRPLWEINRIVKSQTNQQVTGTNCWHFLFQNESWNPKKEKAPTKRRRTIRMTLRNFILDVLPLPETVLNKSDWFYGDL